MKVIIQTQTYENYGAHAWEGDGPCPQRWKPKGGDTFIFTCNRSHQHDLPALVAVNNDYFIEEILEIIVVEEAFFNVRDYCRKWESPTFIERGIDCWLAQRVTVNEFDEFDWTRQSWIHGKAQYRTASKFEVCLDGEVMTHAEHSARQEQIA